MTTARRIADRFDALSPHGLTVTITVYVDSEEEEDMRGRRFSCDTKAYMRDSLGNDVFRYADDGTYIIHRNLIRKNDDCFTLDAREKRDRFNQVLFQGEDRVIVKRLDAD